MHKKILIIAVFFSGIALFLAGYLSYQSKEQEPSENLTVSYIQKFENFDFGTTIEIIDENLIQSKLEIKNNSHSIPYTPNTEKFLYAIKNNSKAIDIEIFKHLKLQARISGLSPREKVQWVSGDAQLTQAIPADWAGRLILTAHNTLQVDNLCLLIINDQKSKICFLQQKEETT